MKIAIDLGHGCPYDGGAVGVRREEDLINEVGEQLIEKLQQLGHTAIKCRPSWAKSDTNSLWQRCNTANVNKADIFVSLHFNAYNGKAYGTETFAISNAGRRIATSVQQEICKLGFYNRGVKTTRYYVLRNTNMPAILIEGAFCDSKRDMKLFDAEKMADAIVRGLV
ncbi:N-acetylmuramoyl-L-alanine amidase [Calothrix rhizosoleniae]|uniref:N-acetylmuramoyl-L-alanine amidase n=1 Tax=Calothrix rhizosoleniae TaxID=888997 RepID=UPI000B4A47C3|nr:N-acetylmuramoyl-L-alanine amidase [Calothrix rhizosoleniae]